MPGVGELDWFDHAARDIGGIPYTPPEDVVRWARPLVCEVLRLREQIAAVHGIALRFGREYNADDPSAMAQDVAEHVAAGLSGAVG